LNLRLNADQSLIIMGPSGTGKSSILRIICGLWPTTTGTILCPVSTKRGIFFVPQKCYLTLGSLREQFYYPRKKEDFENSKLDSVLSDPELRSLMQLVELEYILDRFGADAVADWAVILSVGEQQRIGMARLFFHKPTFAILDESTSAVDSAMEEKFYAQCRLMKLNYISVAHRPSCMKYHDKLLRLRTGGEYTFTDIPDNEKWQPPAGAADNGGYGIGGGASPLSVNKVSLSASPGIAYQNDGSQTHIHHGSGEKVLVQTIVHEGDEHFNI